MALTSISTSSAALANSKPSSAATNLNKIPSGTKVSSEAATTYEPAAAALSSNQRLTSALTPSAPDPKVVAYRDSKIALDSILMLQRTDPAKASDSQVNQALDTYFKASQNYYDDPSRSGVTREIQAANAKIDSLGSIARADISAENASLQMLQTRQYLGAAALKQAEQAQKSMIRLF